MARRVMASRSVIRGPRRQTQWLGSALETDAKGLAGGASVLDQSFTQAQIQALGPLTVVRTRGVVYAHSDQGAASENANAALGFMVVREQARAAGIASIPSPITEEFDDGFFVHEFFGAQLQVASAAGIQLWPVHRFDSKAQRKVTPDDAIVVTLENANATDGLQYILKFRMLVKLH